MDPYDSDSSFEDDADLTETGVLLGYGSEEVIDDTISHLGGWPTWLDETTPPPGEFADCKVCNHPMLLLLELNGDLPEHFPDDERRLYIFGCPRKACNRKPGSVRALRATRKLKIETPQPQQTKKSEPEPEEAKEEEKQQPEQAQTPKPDLGASLFGSSSLTGSMSTNANPFSSNSSAPANPFAAPATSQPAPVSKPEPAANKLAETFADKVKISTPQAQPTQQPPETTGPSKPWPEQSAFPTPYTQFYLDAEYETLSRPSTPTIPENVQVEKADEDSKGGSGADLKDAFESEMDKAFIRFSTRLGHNPEQVLRYEFRGSPLLYSYIDGVGKKLHEPHQPAARMSTISSGSRFPRCEYCGGERVFELQLVPHAIAILEEGREGVGLGPKDDGMEWGTIILGVCGRDCGPKEVGKVGWREEWVGVQWEEAAK